MKITSTFVACSLAFLILIFGAACTREIAATSSYAEDRALIEDLQARYMFALDFGDMETFAKTFAEDGIIDIGDGEVKGRQKIVEYLNSFSFPDAPAEDPELRPATGRHNITNIVIRIDGDRAVGRAYWFHYGNNNPQRTPTLNSYGHYEDEMVKVNGEWLFSRRLIYNEQVDKWAANPVNPAW
ncbi:MAG TPA: nuclear transport factor 2 family protein [Acidobacteriota bacterium]|nr:nuclear transport factor 2 family protein [Acidobacteriota bacterium]